MSPARRVSTNWFWVAVAVSLVASLTPWADILLYPFKLFTTWVHECGHALMTVLTGGRVMSISIEPDTSGLTQSLVPVGRVAGGLVASSGYLGAAMVGAQEDQHVILAVFFIQPILRIARAYAQPPALSFAAPECSRQ